MDENKNIEKPKQKKNHNKSGVMKLLKTAGMVAGAVAIILSGGKKQDNN